MTNPTLERIQSAVAVAVRHGQTDGSHHKAWVIDQMIRALVGESDYLVFVRDYCKGEDGPNTYEWDEGIAP